MKKVKKILILLMADFFLCYIVAGNIPLAYYVMQSSKIESLYPEENWRASGGGGGDGGLVIFFAGLFFLFLILFFFDIIFTIVAIRKIERSKIYRNIIVLIMISCITGFLIRSFYAVGLMIPRNVQEDFKLKCSFITIIDSLIVLAIYVVMHKRIFHKMNTNTKKEMI